MSSVTISHGDNTWRPGAEPGRILLGGREAVARAPRSFRFGTLVATGDLVALGAVLAWLVPDVLQWWVPVFVLCIVGLFMVRGQYRTRITLSVVRDAGSVVTCVAASLVALSVLEATGVGSGNLQQSGVAAGAAVVAVLLARFGMYASIRRWRKRGAFKERTLIVGAGPVAVRLAETLDEHPEYGLWPVGFLDDRDGESLPHPWMGRIDHLDQIVHEQRISRVIVAFGLSRDYAMVEVLRASHNAVVDIHVLPRFFELGFGHEGKNVDVVWGYPLLHLPRTALRVRSRLSKRLFDICVAGVLLALCLPLYIALALAVKCTSPGPVYFRQSRVGKHGKVVDVLKFRSMRVNNDSDTQWNVATDVRVTPVGAIIRKTSLDELPQLWNVLRGDMSLVGPRPERPFFVAQFEQDVRHYQSRHRVPAGLTGLAQVNGLRGDTSIDERAWFDNHYIDNWTLGRDVVILARTAGAVVRQARGSSATTTTGPVESLP
jgi:exopolysaccharide biosynthesis polyprenyl glycosylphosphotransferase